MQLTGPLSLSPHVMAPITAFYARQSRVSRGAVAPRNGDEAAWRAFLLDFSKTHYTVSFPLSDERDMFADRLYLADTFKGFLEGSQPLYLNPPPETDSEASGGLGVDDLDELFDMGKERFIGEPDAAYRHRKQWLGRLEAWLGNEAMWPLLDRNKDGELLMGELLSVANQVHHAPEHFGKTLDSADIDALMAPGALPVTAAGDPKPNKTPPTTSSDNGGDG